MESDEQLARRISQRDSQAFDVLMRRYREQVIGHVLRIVRNDAAADDLTQETFLRVWERAAQWDGSGPLRSWLMRIATNLALNHLRSVRRSREQPLRPTAPSADEDNPDLIPGWMVDAASLGPDEIADRAEQGRLLRELLDELPDEKREVLQMIHEQEMDLAEVADLLGIPVGTVKSRLHYASRWLGKQWRDIQSRLENPQ